MARTRRTAPRRGGRSVAALAAMTLVLTGLGLAASAHPEEGHEDGPPDEGQHGTSTGHLPASASGVELVGRVDLTHVAGGVADVAALGNHAYLAAFHPECAGRNPESGGTGVHVVDFSDPENPVKVNFLPAEPNSYVGEGVHLISFEGRDYLLHNNETCSSSVPVTSGFAVWDVTDPVNAVKLGQWGDASPAIGNQTFHTTHSVQGFVWQDKAYAVAQDNQDARDVDIFDLTPALRRTGDAVLVAERGVADWPATHGRYANGDSVFHHDMQQQVIDGRNVLAVSYWDLGQVLLDISDPADPVYLTDSDFVGPDPQTGFDMPEGNSHQSYFSPDGRFLLSSDEDFSTTRTLCRVLDGSSPGVLPCGEFGWTVPLASRYPTGFEGRTIWGGSGCVEDVNGNAVSDRAEVPAATSPTDVLVLGRGTCFFSTKVESAQLAGYQVVAIANSHAGSRNGLLPDAFICGSQGHTFAVTASAICIGHRAAHELFGDAAEYTGPDLAPGGDVPAIGTVGNLISARGGVFDGWGYLRLHDATQPGLPEIDTYAVPEALDPAYATGFGNLTIHEVKTDPRPDRQFAYASWYDAGLRVFRYGSDGLTEVGHYIAEGGNDFWGVYPVLQKLRPEEASRGEGNKVGHRPLLLMSDRDSGLWILRYTGKE